MRCFILLILLALGLNATAQFGKHFRNKTLRYDYFHSGSVDAEYIMPDELILEGKWSGPKKGLIDPFDYGNHKMTVFDAASGKLIFTSQYSSLFAEYQATEEAKSQCGNFPESVLMPFPKKPVKIEFYSRGKEMVWNKVFETELDPKTAEVKSADLKQYPVARINRAGNPAKKFDIVFLPEGYTEAEMDKFIKDCHTFAEYLFTTEPYGEYRKMINITGVLAASAESGTDVPQDSVFRETLLHSGFNTFNTPRYLTTPDFKAVRNVAGQMPYDQVVILVNHALYGGGGIYNFYAISTVDDQHSGFVFTHEFGHSFAGLGDEYSGTGSNAEDIYTGHAEPWEPNITTLADFGAKWQDMLPEGTPVPTPVSEEWQGKVGVFEGAGYMEKGAYRPYLDCSMNVVKFNNFCPVCQRAIRERIEYYGGK